jgi:hypothetical protein
MQKRFKRIILYTGAFLAILTLVWVVGQNLFLGYLVDKIESQLYSLRDAGYSIKYDSIKLNWDQNSIEIHNLTVERAVSSNQCKPHHFIQADYILGEGIQIMPLLLKRKLVFDKLSFDSAKVVLHESYFSRDSIVHHRNTEFSIRVNELHMPGLSFQLLSKDLCESPFQYTSNAYIKNFSLAFYKDQPAFGNLDQFLATAITVVSTVEQYTVEIKSININLPLRLADIDTVRIIPHFGNYAFSRKRGFQTDRFDGLIPYINLYGLDVHRTADTLGFSVQKLTTQLMLNAYRDKRIPYRHHYKKLPIEQITSLPFGLRIDSIILNKSYVRYEEFAEEGDSSGHVFFRDIYASIRNVDNRVDTDKETILIADGSFMGEGQVHLKATFPTNPAKKHHVSGTIERFDLKHLNTILEPILMVRAEEGFLDKLTFSFSANSTHAQGKMSMDYRDLKLVSFRSKPKKGLIQKLFDTDDDKVQKAGFKTFIINTFIIRKDRDKKQPFESRTGTIDFDRNKSKYIFNYWWKAVGSGVKSAYKIDKLEDSKFVEAFKKKEKG